VSQTERAAKLPQRYYKHNLLHFLAAVASETNVITWLGGHERGIFSSAFYIN